eukprot:761015-Hanusia_phi.AAC.1
MEMMMMTTTMTMVATQTGVVISPSLFIALSDSRHYAKIAEGRIYKYNPFIWTPEDLATIHGEGRKQVNGLGEERRGGKERVGKEVRRAEREAEGRGGEGSTGRQDIGYKRTRGEKRQGDAQEVRRRTEGESLGRTQE